LSYAGAMTSHAFRILNVFAIEGDRLSGNPLCVFEDGRTLDDRTMLALARQMNLSETTFVVPPTEDRATARVRIFTPTFEMPFAGHPTLGTAHVVRSLRRTADLVTLEMKAGLVEVRAAGDRWTLRAARAPETRVPEASPPELAEMLGLAADVVGGAPLWIDTGAEQLVVPLRSEEDVRRARPNAELLGVRGFSKKRGASMAYVWAPRADGDIVARFFFLVHGGVVEDPATGSACANLGGYLIATGAKLPYHAVVSQGDAVGRPSRLVLDVDADGNVFVGGYVVELGAGALTL
jgi:trans-2,3-dihydro-3-hydroxyanthranilate isomerase